MPDRFEWVPDVTRGEWLRPMEAEPFNSILSVVPRGFEAYARVFHPVERDRPRDTNTWHGVDVTTHFDGVDDIRASLETQRVTWAEVAASFGTTMHGEAQFARLARCEYGNVNGTVDTDGWRYSDAPEGCLDSASLAAAAAVLARHTTTPDAGVAAIWEGWGGQIAAGPRLDLHGDTGRHYILFEAGANDFADAAWPDRAPWVNEAMWAQSPSILWPDDHSWVLATEIDFDSTLVAGTAALIRELVQTPSLEVLPIHISADLTWDGDGLNRHF
jgi:hypothetical protein